MVELYYRSYGANSWIPLELTNYPEFFRMPAFGDYYEATLDDLSTQSSTGWFDLRVVCTDNSGNSQDQKISPAFKIDSLLNVENRAQEKMQVFPNPFNDRLSVVVPESDEKKNLVTITDLTGRIVVQNEYYENSFIVDTDHLSEGMYLLTVRNNRNSFSRKMIKH